MKLFKKLGELEKAKEIIKYYIENRTGDRRFFDLDAYSGISKIDDPDVIDAFQTKQASLEEDINANELILKMAESRRWNTEELKIASEL